MCDPQDATFRETPAQEMARAPDRASKHPRAISTQPNPQGASAWRTPAQLADRPARSSRAPKLTQRCQAGADTEPHRANGAAASGHLGICLLGEQRSSSSSPLTSPTPAMKAAAHRLSFQLHSSPPEGEDQELRLEKEQPASLLSALRCAAEPCCRAVPQSRAAEPRSIPAPWRR